VNDGGAAMMALLLRIFEELRAVIFEELIAVFSVLLPLFIGVIVIIVVVIVIAVVVFAVVVLFVFFMGRMASLVSGGFRFDIFRGLDFDGFFFLLLFWLLTVLGIDEVVAVFLLILVMVFDGLILLRGFGIDQMVAVFLFALVMVLVSILVSVRALMVLVAVLAMGISCRIAPLVCRGGG